MKEFITACHDGI